MKRKRKHVLAEESKLALRNFLPSKWIFREKIPDYGVDIKIEVVEGENIIGKTLLIQLRATEDIKHDKKGISYQMKTKYLKYYENCRLPVLILY